MGGFSPSVRGTRLRSTPSQRRVCHGVLSLLVAFSKRDEVSVSARGESVVVTIDGETHELSRDAAAALEAGVEDALTHRESFFRTACVYREDGSYVVERRGAESTGNSAVFETFEEVRRLFDRMPDEFGAEDVGKSGLTGSRRHMLVRHFAEHPSFPCEIETRSPLRVVKLS